jgi:hypothetical protein
VLAHGQPLHKIAIFLLSDPGRLLSRFAPFLIPSGCNFIALVGVNPCLPDDLDFHLGCLTKGLVLVPVVEDVV